MRPALLLLSVFGVAGVGCAEPTLVDRCEDVQDWRFDCEFSGGSIDGAYKYCEGAETSPCKAEIAGLASCTEGSRECCECCMEEALDWALCMSSEE